MSPTALGFSIKASSVIRPLHSLQERTSTPNARSSNDAELQDGRFSYEMKRPLPGSRTHLILTGIELLKRLTPLIPPPYGFLVEIRIYDRALSAAEIEAIRQRDLP